MTESTMKFAAITGAGSGIGRACALGLVKEGWTVALHRVLTDDTLYAELSTKSLKRAQHFSWERAARETLNVYRQVAGKKPIS